MSKQSTDSQSLPGDVSDSILIQLHLAEYQALTTRASYWIVLQFSLLPAVPVYIVLAYQAWQSGSIKIKEIVVWSTLAVLQLVAMLWSNTMLEQFAIVKYIECYLRPQIGKELFWGYEPYLVKHRAIKSTWGNYSIPSLGLIVLVIILIPRFHEFSLWDAGGVTINLILLAILWNFSFKISKMQRIWSNFDEALVQKLEEVRNKIDTPETQANL
jgi:hypothetical protein